MQPDRTLRILGVAAILLAATPAWGAPTFSYTTDFEADADGATPLGWAVSNSGDTPVWVGTSNDPKVMAADPADWGSISTLGAAGVVNYAIPWSGGKRFTILHPGWTYNAAFASGATFTGTGATYSGTYPMNLQTNSLKAVFDMAARTGRTSTSTHGFVFTVQPVEDGQHVRIVGHAYGREGYDQNGFGVEVDVYTNTGGGGSGAGDPDNSHVGINLYRLWDIAGSVSGLGITVPSVKTNVEQGVAVPFPNPMGNAAQSKWLSVGNNNQPLHFTVYYNDPNKGGLGVVRVYLKVDPATYNAAYGGTASGAMSFGYDVGDDPVDGKLMVEACIGAWPASGAAFGFVAARSGSTHISQVDNVHVETNAVASGTPCTVTYPTLSWGTPVFDPVGKTPNATLTETPVQTNLTGMTQRGWDVASYVMSQRAPDGSFPTRLDVFKGSIRAQKDGGFVMGSAVGEPNLDYYMAGGTGGGLDGNLGDKRLPPGMPAGQTWAGILAKGWIYFPVGNTDYDLCMNSDNGYEVRIGNQVVSFSDTDGIFTTGLNGGSHFNLHVNTAGVYPIQVLYFDYGGGAYCEFYRRTDSPTIPYLLVGNTTWGVADQPLIFGLRNGAAAPDYISEYSPLPPMTPANLGPVVSLDVQPVTGTLGSPGWNVATYPLFEGGASDADSQILFMQSIVYCDANGLASPVVTGEPNIAYTSENAVGNLTDRLAPGLTAGKWNEYFGLLCNGYIVFPGVQADYPRTYHLAISSDDGAQLKIGGQMVISKLDANAGTGIDAGGANGVVQLVVNKPGIYPIQILYKEGCCGDGIEFYRRNFSGFPTPYVAVGTSQSGFTDQPLIYGTLNGAIPAKDLDITTTYTGSMIVDATLSPTERVGAATDVSGGQLFNIKTVWAPKQWLAGWTWWCYSDCSWTMSPTDARQRIWTGEDITQRNIFYGWGSNGRTSATGWLDTLGNRAGTGGEPRSTTADITCNRSSYSMWGAWYQPLADWEALPNYPPNDMDTLGRVYNQGYNPASGTTPWWDGSEGGNTAVRWDGYAVLQARDYWIGVIGGRDNTTLSIGNQVLQTTGMEENPGRLVRLHVTVPGAYPIRVETQVPNCYGFDSGNWDQIWNDTAGAILYEVTPGHARVPLNATTSSIKVYQNCTPTGPFVRKGVEKILPPERKVAAAGQGGTLGWNGTVVKNGSAQRPYEAAMVGALVKDNMYSANPGGGGGAVAGARDTGIVPILNIWDKWDSPAGTNDFAAGEGYGPFMNGTLSYPYAYTTMTYWQDYFTAGTAIAPNVQNSPFVASFTGYIEFPAAGDYALNICSQDGAVMWIAGDVVNYRFWTDRGGGLLDSSPSFIHVDSGGIWNVRVDYFTENYNSVLQVYQYNSDGTRAYINESGSTIKVYSSLATGVTPATTKYVDPTELDPATAAAIAAGSDKGLRVQVVQAQYDDPQTSVGNAWWGQAHAPLYNRMQAKELLATVLDGAPSINQKGVKVYDGVVNSLVFAGAGATALGNWPGQPLVPFPGLLSDNAFAVRVTGYLALKKGGHIFSFLNDDGVMLELGGREWHSGDATGWAWQSAAYFYAPQDGLYPIKIEYNQVDGGYALHLLEMHSLGMYIWDHAPGDGWEVVNDGDTATKAYAALCPVPWADTDGDQDVDQADFAVFQTCFTGDTVGTLPVQCQCLDKAGTAGTITADDFIAFMSCWSGPKVPSAGCP